MQHRTLEFKLNPTPEQITKLEDYLLVLRWVWNRALGLMEEYKEVNQWHRQDKTTYLASKAFYYDRKKSETVRYEYPDWKLAIEPVTVTVGKKERLVQPVAIAPHIPHLEQLPTSKKNTPLVTIFGHRYHKDRVINYLVNGEERSVNYTDCPFKFIQGILITLSGAWIEFTKRPSDVSPPKFKNSKHPVKSLIHYNAEQIKLDTDKATLTPHKSIGAIQILGLNNRINADTKFNPLKICQKASGWYLQLTIEEDSPETKLTGNVCGIDPGKLVIASLDNKFTLEPAKPFKKIQKKLTRLQRQMSRKGRINNANRAKGEPYIKSANWLEIKEDVAKLHEKTARNRRSFNHWYTSRLTDWFDLLFYGDYSTKTAKAKAVAITDSDGVITGYEKNGQAQQRGRNKSSADIAIGQFLEMLRTKSKEKQKVAIAVNEWHTSQMCPKCGNIHKKGNKEDKSDNLSQRIHKCKVCGFTGDRDVVAAINIKLKGLALLLQMSDKELMDIPHLARISNNQIREYLESEEKETIIKLRGDEGVKFNQWHLYLKLGYKQYIEHTTDIYSFAHLEPIKLRQNLSRLHQYYTGKLLPLAQKEATIEAVQYPIDKGNQYSLNLFGD